MFMFAIYLSLVYNNVKRF